MTKDEIIETVRRRSDWQRLARFDQRMRECDCFGWPAMLRQDAAGRAYYAALDLYDSVDDITLRDRVVARWKRYKRCYERATR